MLTSVWKLYPDSNLAVILRTKKARLDDAMKMDLLALQHIKHMVVSEGTTITIALEVWDIGKTCTLRELIKNSGGAFNNDVSSTDIEEHTIFNLSAEWTRTISTSADLSGEQPQ